MGLLVGRVVGLRVGCGCGRLLSCGSSPWLTTTGSRAVGLGVGSSAGIESEFGASVGISSLKSLTSDPFFATFLTF